MFHGFGHFFVSWFHENEIQKPDVKPPNSPKAAKMSQPQHP